MTVRVRFAPSPTGHLHVGGARTAIFNWLFARHHDGTFIIRVEDTDQARSTRESEAMVLEDLRWLGVNWDEGPDIGGPHAPYRQSERRELYARVAEELIARRVAYRCFCSEEDLEAKRKAAEAESRPPHYDLTCWHLTAEESRARAESGAPFATRFHVPKEDGAAFDADVTIQDLIRGEVTWRKESLGDFILVRSDGMPTYNYSVVVDDHDMEITHVIRAEEHLTNTHRQVLIYRAMGWPVPEFAHVSLILGQDRTKLSKRHGATSVSAYAEEGFLPEAMVNYLTLLGWSPPTGEEQFTTEFSIQHFSLDRVNAAPAVFDPQKLAWLNQQYIQKLSADEVAERIVSGAVANGWVVEDGEDARRWIAGAVPLVQKGAQRLSDILPGLRVLFEFDVEAIRADEANAAALADPVAKEVIVALVGDLEANGGPATPEDYQAMAERIKTATGAKGKALFMPIRIALTGSTHGPELKHALPALEAIRSTPGLREVPGALERARLLLASMQ